jgi:hypothetical protein
VLGREKHVRVLAAGTAIAAGGTDGNDRTTADPNGCRPANAEPSGISVGTQHPGGSTQRVMSEIAGNDLINPDVSAQ